MQLQTNELCLCYNEKFAVTKGKIHKSIHCQTLRQYIKEIAKIVFARLSFKQFGYKTFTVIRKPCHLAVRGKRTITLRKTADF